MKDMKQELLELTEIVGVMPGRHTPGHLLKTTGMSLVIPPELLQQFPDTTKIPNPKPLMTIIKRKYDSNPVRDNRILVSIGYELGLIPFQLRSSTYTLQRKAGVVYRINSKDLIEVIGKNTTFVPTGTKVEVAGTNYLEFEPKPTK